MSRLRPAVFSESLLFGYIRIEINKRWDQDIGGIHDLVTHDDVCKRHAAQLLLCVRLYGLDLGLSYKMDKNVNVKSNDNKVGLFHHRNDIAVFIWLTSNVFLYPRKCYAALFAALTEAQKKCARRLWTQNGSLSLLTDKTHDVSVNREIKCQTAILESLYCLSILFLHYNRKWTSISRHSLKVWV